MEEFTAPAGWKLLHFHETASTNDLAKEAGRAGAPERTLFVTDFQTRGRGRLDRSWLAPPGSSLLFSVLFRRHLTQPMLLTMMCSVAACEAIEEVAALRAEIKWPNDLMLNGNKLAGVLTEVSWSPGNPFAVVGMGLNVNFDPAAQPDLPANATSLLREGGAPVPRPRLLRQILVHLDGYLDAGESALEPLIRPRWASRLWRHRQKVVVADGSLVLEGVFEDVAEDGALLLRQDDGSLREVRVGDLRI